MQASTPPELTYCILGPEGLDRIGALWEQLRDHHAGRSTDFAAAFSAAQWGDRRRELAEKARTHRLIVHLALDAATERPVGYCVSSAQPKSVGEIESLFVEKAFRKTGVGDRFMRHALAWMDEQGVTRRRIGVMIGNEEAFGFYARYGFKPRLTILEQPQEE